LEFTGGAFLQDDPYFRLPQDRFLGKNLFSEEDERFVSVSNVTKFHVFGKVSRKNNKSVGRDIV
jgi:hypothetical protein